MKVDLLDLDKSGFPNLVLMKLSAWHRARGDSTSLNFPLGADMGYASCVFSWNRHKLVSVPPHYQLGGSVLNSVVLPPEIEHITPDYNLYGLDYSLGFTSRGCLRRCDFCIVPQKEGSIRPSASIYEFWVPAHQKLRLLDNNFLASPNWRQTLADIRAEGIKVDFTQGLDIRLLTKAKAEWLHSVNRWGNLYFAFDDIRYERAVHRGIRLLADAGFNINMQMLGFYLLLTPGSHFSQDVHRINILADYGVKIFPMFYLPQATDKKAWNIPRMHSTDLGIKPFNGSRRGYNKLIRLLAWKKAVQEVSGGQDPPQS
tara:strand:+ start:1508 stop:2449 length:942 start_codon:yes stop_codon:yes gene_type:complete